MECSCTRRRGKQDSSVDRRTAKLMIPYAAFCFSAWGLDFCHACAFLLLRRLQTPERKKDTLMQNCVATTVVWRAPTMHLSAYMQASYVQASYVEHILRSILPEHFATLAFLTRSLFAMSGNLLDEAITKANAKDSTVRALFEPKCYRVARSRCETFLMEPAGLSGSSTQVHCRRPLRRALLHARVWKGFHSRRPCTAWTSG